MSDALNILPKPSLVEEISTEVLLDRKLELFLSAYKAETGKDFTALNEASAVVSLIRSSAEEETHLRVRLNQRYRARFVYFAEGQNLLTLMNDEGLTEKDGESDERRRERIRLQRAGSSAAGPLEWYKRKAIEVAPSEIEDINVDFPNASHVRVAILSRSESGIPTAALVSQVQAVLTSDEVHPDDHTTVEIIGAEPVNISIHARITLEPGTDPAVFNALEAHYRQEFAKRRGLGRDISGSWTTSTLHVAGVHSVEVLNAQKLAILPFQVAKLDDLDLELAESRTY